MTVPAWAGRAEPSFRTSLADSPDIFNILKRRLDAQKDEQCTGQFFNLTSSFFNLYSQATGREIEKPAAGLRL